MTVTRARESMGEALGEPGYGHLERRLQDGYSSLSGPAWA